MIIRRGTVKDFKELYKIGLSTPELRVSADESFMEKDDFKLRLRDKNHIFVVAEDKDKIVGFTCANSKDVDRPLKHRWACMVYIAVLPEYRRKRVGTKLYDTCVKILKQRGMTHIYALADADTKAVQKFLIKKGFEPGEKMIWMDRKI